jgi:hypothetical protein
MAGLSYAKRPVKKLAATLDLDAAQRVPLDLILLVILNPHSKPARYWQESRFAPPTPSTKALTARNL